MMTIMVFENTPSLIWFKWTAFSLFNVAVKFIFRENIKDITEIRIHFNDIHQSLQWSIRPRWGGSIRIPGLWIDSQVHSLSFLQHLRNFSHSKYIRSLSKFTNFKINFITPETPFNGHFRLNLFKKFPKSQHLFPKNSLLTMILSIVKCIKPLS